MRTLGDPCRHYWLVKDMARATDVDLVRAFSDGRITSWDWAEMVDRCRACDWVDGCKAWLDRSNAPRHIPSACHNKACLARLKSEQELASNDRTNQTAG